MRHSRLFAGIFALFYTLLLAGCGFFESEERAPWRAQAEAACYARHLVKLTPLVAPSSPIEGPGICGIDRPLRVAALEDGRVSLGSRALVLSCPMTAALERWLNDSVQPAALARYGVGVAELRNFGTYNCRPRNNVTGARLSEHAFANAFDFAGVVLANGRVITVKGDWNGGSADARAFLREVAAGACGPFTTVLGPGSDGEHEDHLHLDLARHNVQGTMVYCKPRPNVPRSSAGPLVAMSRLPAAPARAMAAPGPVADSRYQDEIARLIAGSATSVGYAPAGTVRSALRPAAAPAYSVPAPPVQVAPAYYGVAPAACPPGYVCPAPVPPAPVGWTIGAQPARGLSALR